MKSLFGLSDMFFHEKWKLFDDQSTAFRFPGMLMMGLAIWVTYLFAAKAYSRRAGIVAAFALGLMPNVFYHAHLACFDVPIMAMWIACVFAYWNAEKKGGLGWALVAAIIYGLTLETKHNVVAGRPTARLVVHGRRSATSTKNAPPDPASLVAMAQSAPRSSSSSGRGSGTRSANQRARTSVHHEYYNIEFLGVTYWGPVAASYMPVMIA
jgi:hypothetical protein